MRKIILYAVFCLAFCNAYGQKLTPTKQLKKTVDSLQSVNRILQADIDAAKKQIKYKQSQLIEKTKQVRKLKSELSTANSIIKNHEATIDTLQSQWDSCLDNYHDVANGLQAVTFVIGDKGLPSKKIKLIKQIIEE